MINEKENKELKRYFVKYSVASLHEDKLGRPITLFDPCLFKIKRQEQGKYEIEPILYLNGNDAHDAKTYDTTLIRKKGFLALEITEAQKELFEPCDILEFSSSKELDFNEYIKEDELKKHYDLLDIAFSHSTDSSKVMEVRPVYKNSPYATIEEKITLKGNMEVCIEKLRRQGMGCGLYIEVSPDEVDKQFKKYITSLDYEGHGKYAVSRLNMYLLPFSPDIPKESEDEFYHLVKYANLVATKYNGDTGLFEAYNFNADTRSILTKDHCRLMYQIPNIAFEEWIANSDISDDLYSRILYAQKVGSYYDINKLGEQKEQGKEM